MSRKAAETTGTTDSPTPQSPTKNTMSLIEKAGLAFGAVGLLADLSTLVAFAYGFSSLDRFLPGSVNPEAGISFFKSLSALVIIYGWFIISWYLVRRSFLLRYERPKSFRNPLSSRSLRTIFGVGLFLTPLFVYWSVVNLSFSASAVVTSSSNPATPSALRPTEVDTLPATQLGVSANKGGLGNPLTPVANTTSVVATPSAASLTPPVAPTATMTPYEIQQNSAVVLGMMYYVFGLPFGLFLAGSIIYGCVNALLPMVHVELLNDYE